MKYPQYLECSERHLSAIKTLFETYDSAFKTKENDRNVLLEIYYLSGYIMEGLVVYAIYDIFEWPENIDIDNPSEYIFTFTAKSGVDYFYDRKIKNPETGLQESVFRNRTKKSLSIQGHNFQEIVKRKLKHHPALKEVPYIGEGKIKNPVEELIDEWKPSSIRYYHQGQLAKLPKIDRKKIQYLIETCEDSFNKIRSAL